MPLSLVESLLIKVAQYCNPEEIELINKAYEFAASQHEGQPRDSGEPFITHPVAVAMTLANMHADCNTVCAALLHDTIEDASATKKMIAEKFNPTVAYLVDGVTKINEINPNLDANIKLRDTRRIIMSIIKDVRIVMIKIADRLHNMETLEYKEEEKRRKKALETMEIYVPLAHYIGANEPQNMLEDLSLKFLDPYGYNEINQSIPAILKTYECYLETVLPSLAKMLNDRNIAFEFKLQIRNIYRIYLALMGNPELTLPEIQGLLALKIVVNKLEILCFEQLSDNPGNITYITSDIMEPLPTVIFGPDDYKVTAKLYTPKMEAFDNFGLMSYWKIYGKKAAGIMQQDLEDRLLFYKILKEIDENSQSDSEFISSVRSKVFNKVLY